MPALPATADAVVIGAGIVGASCAHYLADAGLSVVVVDRGPVSSGTTSAGEGNILVSDKDEGPELDLALVSIRLWRELGQRLGDRCELEAKGGLVVARTPRALTALRERGHAQRGTGVEVVDIDADDLHDVEPHLTPGLAGGALYPQDMQVQPMLAAALTLALPRQTGSITTISGCTVHGIDLAASGVVIGVRTSEGTISTPAVINAAGTWGSAVAQMAGVHVPVLPRRGFILVTEPLPLMIRRKVYTADYVDNVASSDAGLETSTVVEGTRAGTILIGASRQRVGFDRSLDWTVIALLAAKAIEVFPFLRDIALLRTYAGLRPYCPDHLPVIGSDPRVPGLFHACGHEGAGIGLAPATGHLIAQAVTGAVTDLPMSPYRPDRFDGGDHE
jgi:glycine/D-amino acid oxidase-like deaminating enzyme